MTPSDENKMPDEIWAHFHTGSNEQGAFRTYDTTNMFKGTGYTLTSLHTELSEIAGEMAEALEGGSTQRQTALTRYREFTNKFNNERKLP